MVLLTALAAFAAPTCDLAGPSDARFEVPVEADRVRVVLEVWLQGAPSGWADGLLDALDLRGVAAVVVLPAGEPDPERLALLARVDDGPHEAAVVLPPAVVPRAPVDPVGPLKRLVRPVRAAAGRVRTVVAPIGTRVIEAKLGQAGFHSLVDLEGAPTASPRMAGVFEGQQRINVVVPAGPYEDACGPDPRVGPFTPRAADRAAQAVQRANRAEGTPVVRVALLGSRAAPTDAEVLGRWIDEVLAPGGVRVGTAEEARIAALIGWRNPRALTPPTDAGAGRLVAVGEVRTAAEALREVTALPRRLPGDLALAEAFHALALVAAGRTEGDVVRLGALRGPASLASTTLDGPTELPAAAVRGTAEGLLSALPDEVPAALSVGGRLLTAGELLLAFASVVRGDDPATTRPVGVPEPNERGLGWGEATLP